MDFTALHIIELVAIGLVAGVLGGMLGVGGGVIFIPGMTLLVGIPQHLAQASAMVTEFFVAGPAGLRHAKEGVVVKRVIKRLIPGAVVGVALGVSASNLHYFKGAGQLHLSKIFAIFMIYVIAYNTYRLIRFRQQLPAITDEVARRIPGWRATAIGLGMGFGAGLLGIGGGALAVPAQQIFLKLPIKNAIGNSACTIVFSALLGALIKNWTLDTHGFQISESLLIAITLIPTSFIGASIGARLTHKLPRHPVRLVFVIMLVFAAFKMWFRKSESPAHADPTQEIRQPAEPRDATTQPADDRPRVGPASPATRPE